MQTLPSVFSGIVLLNGSNVYLEQVTIIINTADQQYGSDTAQHTVTGSTSDFFKVNKHTDTDVSKSSSFGLCPRSDVQIKQKVSEAGSASILR
jgi:hypothetical protein